MGNGSEMETLASHFPLHSRALDFPVITFVVTFSPERRLRVIIHSAGRGERAESIAAAQAQHSKPTPQLPSLEGSGELLHPHGGSLFLCPRAQCVLERLRNAWLRLPLCCHCPLLSWALEQPCLVQPHTCQGFLSAQTLSRPHPTSHSTSLAAGFGLGGAGGPLLSLPGCVGSAGGRTGRLSRSSAQFVFI